MIILNPIVGHFGLWRPSCFLKIIQIIIVAQLFGNGACLSDFLFILGLIGQFQKQKHHQNVHFGPIGGHFGFWRPFCFFKNHPYHQCILVLGSVPCLCDVLSRLGLINPTQKPKHHKNGHFQPIGGHFESWRPSCFFKNHPNQSSMIVLVYGPMFV